MAGAENINLFEAKVLLTVMEDKNISGVVSKVSLTQSAISKLVMRIEQNYNVMIFDKNKKPWQLTPAGLIFREFLLKILKEHEALLEDLNELVENRKGSFTLYTMPYEDKYVLPSILSAFYRKNPSLAVNIVLDNTKKMEEALLDKKADLAIVVSPVKSDEIQLVPIIENETIIAIPNDFLLEKGIAIPTNKQLKDIDISLFKEKPFILHKKQFKVRDLQEEIFRENNFYPLKETSIEVEQHITGVNLAAEGLGICFLSDDSFGRLENTQNISFFRIKGSRPMQTISIGYLKSKKLSLGELDFINIAKEKYPL